jgi:hypothetical protein
VLRTVFLPTVDSDFLLLKVESLQAQLNEQVTTPHPAGVSSFATTSRMRWCRQSTIVVTQQKPMKHTAAHMCAIPTPAAPAPQKQLHEERVAALLTDRQLRAQEEQRQRSNLMVQVEALARQVKQLEEALQTTTRDYISGGCCMCAAHAAGAGGTASQS